MATITKTKPASRKPNTPKSTKTAVGNAKPKKPNVNVFHQRLGQLTYVQACQLLGEQGVDLIRQGSKFDIDHDEQVYLGGDLYRVRLSDGDVDGGTAIATITLQSHRNKQLQFNCDKCDTKCVHLGAAISHLLEGKGPLGLAAPPDESVAMELLTNDELHRRMLHERKQRAETEKMTVRAVDRDHVWTDYLVTSESSGRTYRVALRGKELGESFCTCPDFRTNHLGTCKHILHTLQKAEGRFSKAELSKPYRRKTLSISLHYVGERGIRFHLPAKPDSKLLEIVGEYADKTLTDPTDAMRRIQALENADVEFQVYPDADRYIQTGLTQARLLKDASQLRKNPTDVKLRKELLKTELLPYQMDGVAFAVGAGRAILADDMGLGKTIQGIGVAELLAKWADISRVLIVCPASLKSQWRSEVHRFSDRSVQLVIGSGEQRAQQYAAPDAFFTVCNYEQVMRDLTHVEAQSWDLIILDEGQRIKNWESKTSQVIRQLESPFSLVLSGTPLENRLDDLFTVVRFVDDAILGPAHRFFHRHRVANEKGAIIGYQKLDELRKSLRPILLRRTRDEVIKQLPDRTDEIVRIAPTAEQKLIHDGYMQIVAQIVAKKYITEMDMLRLRQALGCARMSADSTFLVDQKEPEYSSKLDRLTELLEGLVENPSTKIILFSEWRRMLNRVERILGRQQVDFVRLDGQVPQKKRAEIVNRFQNDPTCRVILMTNAGSTGLNLQRANVVINADLPWNPAVLEQRIARAHRMGQTNPVYVYNLVTEDTIEEKLLETLAAKQDLADAAINLDSDVNEVHMRGGMDELRRRLEIILQPKFAKPVDESQKLRVENETIQIQSQRERVSAAGGELLGAALKLVGELVAGSDQPAPNTAVVDSLEQSLSQCAERDANCQVQLRISLADPTALRSLAESLARLLGTSGQ